MATSFLHTTRHTTSVSQSKLWARQESREFFLQYRIPVLRVRWIVVGLVKFIEQSPEEGRSTLYHPNTPFPQAELLQDCGSI